MKIVLSPQTTSVLVHFHNLETMTEISKRFFFFFWFSMYFAYACQRNERGNKNEEKQAPQKRKQIFFNYKHTAAKTSSFFLYIFFS